MCIFKIEQSNEFKLRTLSDQKGADTEPQAGCAGVAGSVDVLGHPAEPLPVALSLQHAAHEHLQGPGIQVLQWCAALQRDTHRPLQLLVKKTCPYSSLMNSIYSTWTSASMECPYLTPV